MGVVPLWRAADAPKQQQKNENYHAYILMRDFLISNNTQALVGLGTSLRNASVAAACVGCRPLVGFS